MASLTGIGLSGLNAAQASLLTTSHNITNANVDGYTRQRVLQSTQTPLFSGVGFFGQGTQIDTVKRVYSEYLNNQVAAADTARADYDTFATEIKQIDNLLADESSGLSPAMQEFFRGVQSVAANPSSIPARQTLLSDGESLTTRLRQLNTRMEEIRSGLESQINDSASYINSLARQVADLNLQIVSVQVAGPGVPANDLQDKRDGLIAQLNEQIRTTTSTQSDGSVSVFIGTGQPLVIGTDTFTLRATPANSDPKRLTMGLLQPNGSVVQLPESLLTGGVLGGLLRFRTDALDSAQNSLGRIALGLAISFNAQHQLGQNLNGVQGGNFFAPLAGSVQNLPDPVSGLPSPAVLSARVTSVSQLTSQDYVLSFDGTNYEMRAQPDGSLVYSGTSLPGPRVQPLGTSTASITVASTANVTGVAQDYMFGFDGSNYSLTRQTDGAIVYSGTTPPTSVEGLTLTVSGASAGDQVLIRPGVDGLAVSLTSGTISAGERFLIQPTHYAAQNISMAISDTRLIAAASPFRTAAATANAGNGQISGGITMAPSGFDTNGDKIADFGPLTLTFNGSAFTVLNTATATTLTMMPNNNYAPATDGAGKTFELNVPGQPRVKFTISGTPLTGDVFRIEPNLTPPATAGGAATSVGVSDSRNMVALGQLQSAKTMLGGTASFQYAYSQIVSGVGAQSREAQVGAEAQQGLLDQAKTVQQGMSGVNIDEEAANLVRFQQAYQASARVLEISGKLFEEILSVAR